MMQMRLLLICVCLFLQNTVLAKPIFIGDSLTLPLAKAYSQSYPVDARYKVSSGLSSKKVLNWQEYVEHSDFSEYSTVYVMLGTNDLITSENIQNYRQKVSVFLQAIKQTNPNIVWILPPSLKDVKNNILLQNTRSAINLALADNSVNSVDMQDYLGKNFTLEKNGFTIRTQDGIHITTQGALLLTEQITNRKSNHG